jgi:hypothetical protein
MKYFKIATMVLFVSVCLTMVSGSFAADNTILPIPIVNEKWINVGVGENLTFIYKVIPVLVILGWNLDLTQIFYH